MSRDWQLAHKPKPKSKPARKRARRAKKLEGMSIACKVTPMCSVCQHSPATRVHKFKRSGYVQVLCDDCAPRLCTCPRDKCNPNLPATICRFVCDRMDAER